MPPQIRRHLHSWRSHSHISVLLSEKNLGHTPNVYINEIRRGASMTGDGAMRRLARASLGSSNAASDAHALHLASEAMLIHSFELVWHLAEIVFIQVLPSRQLTLSLCSWFHVQSQETMDTTRFLLLNHSSRPDLGELAYSAERDSRFWPTVLALVLQVRPAEAIALLAIHSQTNLPHIRNLRQLLRDMPLPGNISGGNPIADLKDTWRYSSGQLWTYWQSECHRLLVRDIELSITHDSSDAGYLYLIGRVLSGDSDSDLWHRDTRIIESSGGPTAWYFRFVSRLFYTTLSSQSSVDVEHLSSALTQWRRDEERDSITLTEGQAIKYGEDFQEPQPIDETITALVEAIFKADLLSFFRLASESYDNWWLVAHFSDLLNHTYPDLLAPARGALSSSSRHRQSSLITERRAHTGAKPEITTQINPGTGRPCDVQLVRHFISGYAETLATDTSLLGVVLGYHDWLQGSPSTIEATKAIQTTLLVAEYPTSTRAANWLLREATSRGLSTAAEEISRCQARRAWPPTPAPSVTVCPATVSATYAAASVHNSCLPLSWIIRDAPRANCLVDRLVRRCLFEASVWRTGFWQMDRVYSPDNLADVAEDEMSKVDDQQKHQEPEADPNWKLLEDEIIELATILHAALAASLSSQSSSFSVLNLSPLAALLVRYAEARQRLREGNHLGALTRLFDMLASCSPASSVRCEANPIPMSCSAIWPWSGRSLPGSGWPASRVPLAFRFHLLRTAVSLIAAPWPDATGDSQLVGPAGLPTRDQIELLLAGLIELRTEEESLHKAKAESLNSRHSLSRSSKMPHGSSTLIPRSRLQIYAHLHETLARCLALVAILATDVTTSVPHESLSETS